MRLDEELGLQNIVYKRDASETDVWLVVLKDTLVVFKDFLTSFRSQ